MVFSESPIIKDSETGLRHLISLSVEELCPISYPRSGHISLSNLCLNSAAVYTAVGLLPAAFGERRRLGNIVDESQRERGRMTSFGCWLDMIILIHILGRKQLL